MLIVGAGGLGTHLADLLGRAGVGQLILADDDRIETVNLHRQVLFTEADAAQARLKAQAVAAAVAAANSTISVEAVLARITGDNVLPLVERVDLVLDATDHFPTRFVINDACVKLGRPWVMAGVVATEGQVLPIRPGLSPCLRCILDGPPAPEDSPTAATVGVLGPVVAVLAAWQACEALKLLTQPPKPFQPVLWKLDPWLGQVRPVDLSAARDPDCHCCGQGRYDFLPPAR